MLTEKPTEVRPGDILCRLDDLEDPGSHCFKVVFDGGESEPYEFFVVRKGDCAFAYVNDCPHQFLPLNWKTHSFLNLARTRILCVMHAGTFDIETGQVMSGPMPPNCALEPVPVSVEGGLILLAVKGLPHYE